MRVVELGEDSGFGEEPFPEVDVLGGVEQYLDGDLASDQLVLTGEHEAVAALAEVTAAAVRLPRVGYIEVLNRGLEVMDTTAISLCMDNKLPIVVFDLTERGNIRRIVMGEPVGSVVSGDVVPPRG